MEYSFLAQAIFRIATEGRKARMYEVCMSHSWKAGIIGGTEVRENLVSYVVHRCKKKQAHMLLQNPDQSAIAPTLKNGQMLFAPSYGEAEILNIPKVSTDDMNEVAARIQPQLQSVAKPGTALVQGVTGGPNSRDFGPQTCKELRQAQRLSLRKLAEKAGLDAKSGYVQLSKYENGRPGLKPEEITAVQRVLGRP
jgi:hypothetical protein